MCDVLVALQDTTKNGSIVFGKNSDRPVGECQVLHFAPAGQFTEIECSHLKLSLDRAFLATMGCRPYWCWGYETAVNEAGVVGGNTAVFTRKDIKDTTNKTPGLSGCDCPDQPGRYYPFLQIRSDAQSKFFPVRSQQEGGVDALRAVDHQGFFYKEPAGSP